jgi:hypothetical protein
MEITVLIWSSPPQYAESQWRYFLTTATALSHEQQSLHFPEHSANARAIWFPGRTRRQMLLAYRHNRVPAFARTKAVQGLTDRRRD